jgi:hypothetical protein
VQSVGPEREAVEIPIGDHQHVGFEGIEYICEQRTFISPARAERGGDGGMGTTFLHSHHADLGKRACFGPSSKRPNSVTLSELSATSSMNPSTAINRRDPSQAPSSLFPLPEQ